MTLSEKLKALAAADTDFVATFGARFFPGQAPDRPTLPYVVISCNERVLQTHNAALQETRPWGVYMYAYAASHASGERAARQLQELFCDNTDADIQSLTLDEGIQYLGFMPETKVFAFSVCFDVWENMT